MTDKQMETRLKMEALASACPDFKQLHDFFRRLAGLSKEQYLVYCRSHMPGIAEAIYRKNGMSSLVVALQNAPVSSDEEVVALSAKLMESMIKTVEKL